MIAVAEESFPFLSYKGTDTEAFRIKPCRRIVYENIPHKPWLGGSLHNINHA